MVCHCTCSSYHLVFTLHQQSRIARPLLPSILYYDIIGKQSGYARLLHQINRCKQLFFINSTAYIYSYKSLMLHLMHIVMK